MTALRFLLPYALVAAAAVALTSLFFMPRLDLVRADLAVCRTNYSVLLAQVNEQNKAIEDARVASEKLQQEARKLLDAASEKTAKAQTDAAKLRQELASRTYKDEACEDAAESLRQQWLSR